MRIKIKEDQRLQEIEVLINCPRKTNFVDKLVRQVQHCNLTVKGKNEEGIVQVEAGEIFYIDTVDSRTYIYCENKVYQCELKIYELEEKLQGSNFIRVSKACLLNLEQLKSVKAQINGRMLATLKNGEKLMVNRSYVPMVKAKLQA